MGVIITKPYTGTMTSEPEQILDHLYRPAADQTQNSEVLFLLHGYGSNKEDLFSFANYLPAKFAIIALNAPHALPFGGFAWYELQFTATMERLSNYDQARNSLTLIAQNMTYYCKRYQLDASQISCLGFSQGAILSWALGLDQPQKIKQIIGLSGLIDPELLQHPIEHYKNVVAFASHGTEDATLPIAYTRETVGVLHQNNPQVSYQEYPAGHTINQENFSDMVNWLIR